MKRLTLLRIIFLIYLALLPVHTFASGSLQISDILIPILFLVGFRFRNIYHLLQNSLIAKIFIMFLVYSLMDVAVYNIFSPSDESVTLFIRMLYELIVYLLYCSIFFDIFRYNDPARLTHYVFLGVAVSQVIPFAYFFFNGTYFLHSAREVMSFKNPNQLALFSLSMSIIFTMNVIYARAHHVKINRLISTIILIGLLLEVILSASKASFLVVFLNISVFYYCIVSTQLNNKTKLLLGAVIFIIFVISSKTLFFSLDKYFLTVRSDSLSVTSNTNDFYMRAIQGYEYLLDDCIRFLFGVGTTTNPLRSNGLEFHNIFMGTFNQTGIFSLMMLFTVIMLITYKLYKMNWILFFAFSTYLFYSLFHFSIRSRYSWLLLAYVTVYLILSEYGLKKNRFAKIKAMYKEKYA